MNGLGACFLTLELLLGVGAPELLLLVGVLDLLLLGVLLLSLFSPPALLLPLSSSPVLFPTSPPMPPKESTGTWLAMFKMLLFRRSLSLFISSTRSPIFSLILSPERLLPGVVTTFMCFFMYLRE